MVLYILSQCHSSKCVWKNLQQWRRKGVEVLYVNTAGAIGVDACGASVAALHHGAHPLFMCVRSYSLEFVNCRWDSQVLQIRRLADSI